MSAYREPTRAPAEAPHYDYAEAVRRRRATPRVLIAVGLMAVVAVGNVALALAGERIAPYLLAALVVVSVVVRVCVMRRSDS